MDNESNVLQEAYQDVMAAHKDLIELSDEIQFLNPQFQESDGLHEFGAQL